jgi:hypothetical protein
MIEAVEDASWRLDHLHGGPDHELIGLFPPDPLIAWRDLRTPRMVSERCTVSGPPSQEQ